MMKSKASQQKNRFLRIISTPVRALSKARDFYVKSMTEYADRMNHCGAAMAVPGSTHVSGLPRSFSARPYSDQDFARAPSRAELENLYMEQQMKKRAGPRTMRSGSVAMGRIDEDSPCCYFGEEGIIGIKNEIRYPRSRSHAVSGTRLSAF